MALIKTSVSRIRTGDKIVTTVELNRAAEMHRAAQPFRVERIAGCGSPEYVHLNGGCYDTRFTTFYRMEATAS